MNASSLPEIPNTAGAFARAIYLNVGLNSGADSARPGTPYPFRAIQNAASLLSPRLKVKLGAAIRILRIVPASGAGEDTAVAYLHGSEDLSGLEIREIVTALAWSCEQQDCIAVKAYKADGTLAGASLIGPKAADWGPFNDAFFKL